MILNKKMVRALRKNDADMFEEFYVAYYNVVYYRCYKSLESRVEAEDLTQDIFYKVWVNLKNFDNDEPQYFIRWFLTIVQNSIISTINKPNRIVFDEDIINQTSTSETSKIKYHEFKELCEGIIEEDDMDIILYHAYYDLKFKEISALMNLPTSTISSRYYKAIDKIRGKIK